MAKTKKTPKDTRPVKTLEFKLYPTKVQVETLISWMDKGRKIWNAGLAILEELQQQKFRKKSDFDPLDGHELWEWYVNNVDGKKVYGACCSISDFYSARKHDLKYVMACKIRYPKQLEGAESSLVYQASESFGICSRFKNGIVSDLLASWKAYQDPKRINSKRPKYKDKRFPLSSLSNANASTNVKIKGNNHIQFPLIGAIRSKGLIDRLPINSQVVEARICRKATGWYLQLATRHDWLTPDVKMPDVAVSVDPGVRFATSTDYGRQIKSPKFLTKQCKRLRREQRRASRRFVKGKKSENQSQNWKKQQKKIAKLHEKVARQRNAFWHKESTYFVTNFGGIAIEDNSFDNMGRKAKPKPREDGKGYERNNAKAKSGLNRSLKDVACGKFKVMVAAKAKIINNEIHLVASHYNSQTCSNCGHVAKENRKTQSSFKCVACGHSLNADINAAINIYNRADWSNRYKLHPKRQKLSERRDTPVSIGGIDESQKPASAYRLPLGTEGQQEGDLSPRSEITEQPNPARGMNTGNRQIEARSKTPEVYQNPETHTQLDSWNSSA